MLRAALLSLLVSAAAVAAPASAEPRHGIAMNGEPELPADFTHFPYANPDAPKGGEITYCVVGTFDNMNPFILRSMRTTARGMTDTVFGNLVFEPLMRRNQAEPFSLYGLLAESIDIDDERTYAEFTLNPNARWSDGKPVTPEDVIFTYETFAAKGRPPYSSRMNKIEKIEKTGENKVKFTFNDEADREFPLIVAMTPVIPAHAFDAATFDQTTLKPLTGSGPYVVESVDPGRKVIFRRNPDYWGADVPSMRGFHNYNRITIEYFLNANSQFEAFKKGLCSVQLDLDPLKVERDFDFPATEDGRVVVETFEDRIPPTVIGFFFNTRREIFADPRVRRALSMLYDFAWVNKNVYGGQAARTLSFWQGSDMSALGRPADEIEKRLLAPYMDRILPEVMDGTYGKEALEDGSVSRETMRKALALLQEAGYRLNGKTMLDPQGKPFAIEVIIASGEQERVAMALQRVLERLGIALSIRVLDDAQLQQRKQTFDFDMMIASVGGTASPGIEQIYRWSSISANSEGSFNYAGAADPAIDAMIDTMLRARDKETYDAAVRALDRLLISGAYMIPTQHNPKKWVAHWNYLQHPDVQPLTGYDLSAWWRKP